MATLRSSQRQIDKAKDATKQNHAALCQKSRGTEAETEGAEAKQDDQHPNETTHIGTRPTFQSDENIVLTELQKLPTSLAIHTQMAARARLQRMLSCGLLHLLPASPSATI